MKISDESRILKRSIERLQIKQATELFLLRDQFRLTYESLKPINLINHTFQEAISTPKIKNGFINNALGLTTGYFTKAILVGSSASPIKKIIGALLQFTVATLVARNSESIKAFGKMALDRISTIRNAGNDKEEHFQKNGSEKLTSSPKN